MLGIKRIDHICLASAKVDDRLPMLTELFGMTLAGSFEDPDVGYRGVVLDIPGGGTQWEVIEPLGEDGFLERFLDRRGPGLHHVTFEVESVEEAMKALEEYGYQPFGYREFPRHKEVFVHPRDAGGVLVQLYEGEWEGQ